MHRGSGTRLLIWTKPFPLGFCGSVQHSGENLHSGVSGFKRVRAGDELSHSECKHYEHTRTKYAWYVTPAQTDRVQRKRKPPAVCIVFARARCTLPS